jgi:hypothetical protein
LTTAEPARVAPEPDRAKVQRGARIVTRGLAFVASWRNQRAKYGASFTKIDAFTFEPFGSVRHLRYQLAFRDDKVQGNTYSVNAVREGGRWKVCSFFTLSRNPDNPGVLSGIQNA